jgi:hypothetical protein
VEAEVGHAVVNAGVEEDVCLLSDLE